MKCLYFLSLCLAFAACKKSTPPAVPDNFDVKLSVQCLSGRMIGDVKFTGEKRTSFGWHPWHHTIKWDTTISQPKGTVLTLLAATPGGATSLKCSIDYTGVHAEGDNLADSSKAATVTVTLPK